MSDDNVDALVAGVLAQAVADAGSNNPAIADEARDFLRMAAPDLAERLEARGWRCGRRVNTRTLLQAA